MIQASCCQALTLTLPSLPILHDLNTMLPRLSMLSELGGLVTASQGLHVLCKKSMSHYLSLAGQTN